MLSILVCHSYFLRFDPKQVERRKPYPPLATLQCAALLRRGGHRVSLFDAMLADDLGEYERTLYAEQPQLVLLYEDNFNFLSKMCPICVPARTSLSGARGCLRCSRSCDGSTWLRTLRTARWWMALPGLRPSPVSEWPPSTGRNSCPRSS